MKTRFLKYTFLLAAFLWSVAVIAQSEISIQTHPHYESACAGSATSFTVAATGGNLSYQWYGFTGQGVEALNDGGIYSGTNTPALQISEVSVEMNKRYFFCKISNDSQETRTTSATIRLKNLLINNQPRYRSVYAGDNAIFRMDASGDNIKFQWQRKQDGVFTNLTDGKSYNGVDLSVLIVKEVEAADNASEFRCVVTGGDACLAGSLTTESAVLNVKESLNPVKSMSLLPAETVLTLDNEIVTFSNGTEVTVWGSVVVQGDNGQFSYHNTTNSDKPELEITGSLTNNNTADELFQEDDKTIVTFSGGTDESILGSGLANNFYSLTIDKTGGASLSLDNSPADLPTNEAASVARLLTFSNGKLNLKNNNLQLLPFNSHNTALLDSSNEIVLMPFIQNESNANRIIADAGEVYMNVLVGSNNPIDAGGYVLGNMGLNLQGLQSGVSLFSADNLTIRRGHQTFSINSGSIDRYYKVESGVTSTDIAMDFVYFSDELNGADFELLDFYHNPDLTGAGTFTNKGNTSSSNDLGLRSLENPDVLPGLWTLSSCINAPDVDFPGLGEFNMCFGDNPITLNPSISGTPVDYVWELGFYNQTTFEIDYTIISGATSNTYDVNHNNTVGGVTEYYRLTVSDASGCKGQGFASVTHVPEITVDWSNEPTVQCDLGVYFISGYWNYDNAFYTWSVDNVQQAETSSLFSFTPPAAGTYEISLTTGYFSEGEICPETFTHTISFNDQPLSFSFPYEFEQVNLCGDEQVTLTPENITPADDGSYTYEWFTEDDPETILSNSPTLTVGEGTPYGDEQYLLRITTAIGCFDLQLVSVYTTPVANLDWSALPAIQCDLSPFTFDADWGYEFAVYQWSVDNVLQPSETGAQFNFTPPAAGTYEISVTTGEDDFEGGIVCPTTFTHTITFSEEPVQITFPYAFSEVDVCEAEGSFTLTPDLTPADDGSYTYSWTLAGVEVGTDPTYTITFDAAIETEIYQLTVTTGAGCTDIESVLVYHTESADVDWSALPETVCTLDPYTFDADWGNVAAGFQWNVDDAIQTGETGSTFVFTPPAAGTYTISVITGEYGSIQYCPEQFTHTITFADGEQLAELPFTMSACDVEGGVTPINLETPACTDCTYQWLDATGSPVGTNSNTYTVPDLTENTSYSVEVTKDGCTSTDEIQLFYYFATIDEAATVITNLGCDGAPTGAIDLVFDATEAGYASFSWENVNTADTYFTEDLSGLAAGTYSVTMTDDLNGCFDTATFVVGGGGETVTATSVVVQPSCFGDDNGSITLTPSGGTGTYSYAWSHGPTTIAVTDLSPDTYTVTVSDGNDCEYVETFNIVEPVVLAIDLAKTDLNCEGASDGTITVTTTGGTEPYTYAWSANANNPADPENLTALSGGTYTVTVTDDRNCEVISGITIEEPTNGITASFAATTTGISCNNANDGFISITASGGTGTLTYDWNADTYDGMSEVSNLPPGMYSISVSDENGCPPVVLEITFDNPAALTVSDVIVNPTAAGATDGSIDITVAGGTPDYNYDWADVAGLNNDEDRTALGAGTYTVVITDENDCEITEQYILTEPGELSVTLESVTDISCDGTDDGAIDITVNGGVTPYQFLWSNGAITEDLTNVPAGDYTVMITDNNGIVFNSVTYTVNPPVFLTDNASVTQIDCAGETGMIVLNPTGGTAAYTYAWQHGPTTATVSDLAAGDYTVTISTANDCPFTTTYTIDAAPTAITAEFAATTSDISCNAAADGYILVNASGGTGTLTYDWNVNSLDGSNEHSNLSAGTYIVSVSDENGCPPVVLEITLNNPTVINVTEATTNPTSAGGTDGAIDLTTSGGTPTYTFDWADLAGTDDPEDRTDLPAGTYSVTITDANDCEIIEEYILTEPGQISLVLESITNISCTGTDDGAIDITISGGVAPYTILWSNGAMTEDLSDVPAGDYTVMITDDNGIEFNSVTYTVEPPVFLTDNASISQIDCADGAGTIVLSPTGGTSAYTYAWAHGPTTATVTDLAAGDYMVTISTDNDCPFVGTYTINAAPIEISVTGTASGVCAGSADGIIEIDVTGGIPDYSFVWTNAADNSTVALTEDVMSLPAGDYQVEVTDDNNCVVTFDFNIPEFPSLDGTANVTDVSAGGATDGAIDLTITGGTEEFTFAWSNEDGFMADTEDISDLSVGTYTVLVTDANGCTFTASYTVNEPGALDIVLNITQDIACFGDETGQITATIGGGTEPYMYAWSNSGTTNPLTDLPAGTYTLTATDAAGIVTVSNPITIGEPTEFTINAQVTNPTTAGGNDGSILTAPSGGETPYTFNWSDGTDTYSTSSLNDIGAGNYDLTVTDANGCVATDALATYTLTDPNVLAISLTASQNVSCPEGADGFLTVNASGGVEEYIYNWENAAIPGTSIGATATIDALEAGTYNVTATDADGLMTSNSFDITQPEVLVYNELINNVLCDNPMSGSITLVPTGGTGTYTYLWSNEATTASITELTAGDYSVTITDENNCTYSETFSIVPASLISAMETIVDIDCNGDNTGSINLAPQGGGGTYTYLWSNEATTQNISQLTAGEYSVTISDGGECEFIETYTIDEPTALTPSTTTMQASQPTTADGSIDLTVTGGTGEYSFLWSNAEETEDLENILPGTYSVTITDENECEIVETVSVTSPGGMSVIPTATQITCFGLDNGSISLEIEGGTMPFTVLWSNEATTEIISDLEPGVYGVTVTDDTGFSINTSAEIIEPAEFSLTATPTGVACNGDENGSINITTNNGQSDFSFIWSNDETTQNISGLTSGVYMVTATDDNGCVATQTATVSTPSPLVLTEDLIENPECWDDTNGTIFLSTTGGTGDYEYIWSNGDMTEDIINLSPDTYFVTVTDDNNCTTEMSYEVTAPLPILISFDETNITCGGATVGSITATVTGGTTATGDYDLMWSNGEMTLTINDLTAGIYTLTAEDDNGCTSVESATITQTGSLVLSETQENISCFGEEDGLILVQVVGSGTEPFDYLWSNGQMTDLATGLAAQDYSVTVTDADGCEGVETYIISQPTPMIGTLDAIAASCFDSENGAIEVTVSGGTLETGNDYAFAWSNSATTEDLESLPAGEYTVTITDDNDCQLIETEMVLSPDELLINAIQGGTDCGNTDNISITLEVTGGKPNYLYNWDNGATTSIVENLSEGTYMATVTDDNGCMQSIEQTVSQPTPIAADAFIQRAGCKTENDGLIDVTTTGGLAPYDFAWSNGSFEEDILGLSAGSYSLTVTDATNCVHEMNFEVEIAPEPFAVNFLVNSGLSDTDTLQVNSSDIVQFIDVTLPTPTAWKWSFGDPNNSTSTEQNPQFSYPFDEDLEQTEYMASLVASNEYCRDTITKTILIINNFRPNIPTFDPGENVRFLNVNAYPNPTDDVINLDIEMSKDAEVKVQIVDVLGRVHEERTLTEDDTYNAQFSMKHLTNGVYYVHLSSADRKVTLGVVKVE